MTAVAAASAVAPHDVDPACAVTAALATRSATVASATAPTSATIVSANVSASDTGTDAATAPLHDLSALVVGDLVLEVAPPSDRKTIEIVVERDASLVLKAPPTTTIERAKQFVTAKRPWVYRKLAEKDALTGPPVVKQFVEGEGFTYLGGWCFSEGFGLAGGVELHGCHWVSRGGSCGDGGCGAVSG